MTGREAAVLTGDLVASSKMEAGGLDRAFDLLSEAAETLGEALGTSLRFSRNRGDGWQVLLENSEMALRCALIFRATLRAENVDWDSYIGVAAGAVEKNIPDDLNQATGQIFIDAGIALTWTGQDKHFFRMRFLGLGYADAAFVLADHIIRDWTQAQAAAIRPFLFPEPPTLEEAGKALGISRQAATKARDAAGYDALLQAVLSIEVPSQFPSQKFNA